MDKVFITIFCGVTVYILGQILLKMFIDPVADLKKSISQVQYNLVKFSHILFNSDVFGQEKLDEIFLELRSLSADLLAKTSIIPCYDFTSCIFRLPKINNIRKASTNLIALGNWISMKDHPAKIGHVIKNLQELFENLNLEIEDKDKIDEETLKALINKQ